MSDLLAARSQMGMSLAFHIIFASVGIAMPLFLAISEWRWLRTRDAAWLALAQQWAKGTAIFFAVGAVSGTVLSFELGLLWPGFMREAGAIIGMPFSLEGFAFFTEAIFLGIVLYGWNRVPPVVHMLASCAVAVSGAASGLFVLTANAWMNAPTGFRLVDGHPVSVDPIAAMFGPAWVHETLHMLLAAYLSTAVAVAAIHAFALLRAPESVLHRRAFAMALAVTAVCAPLQIAAGDLSARRIAVLQPAKLAAAEAHFHTQRDAPLVIGGIPDTTSLTTRGALRVPFALSLLAFHDPHAEVTGLDRIPRDEWPNVPLVHWSFDVMVACGTALLTLSGITAWLAWRARGALRARWFLRSVIACGPLGFIALEAGWMVTELGRQPWIIYGVMRTQDAVTPMPHLVVPFVAFSVLYLVLGVVVVRLLRRYVRASLT